MAEFSFYKTNKEISAENKDCLRGSIGSASKVAFVAWLITTLLVAAGVLLSIFIEWWISIIFGVVTLFVVIVMNYGMSTIALKMARQDQFSKKDLFAAFSGKSFKRVMKLGLKRLFLTFFWLIFLIIPAISKNIAYSMSTFVLIDKGKEVENPLAESAHIMKQNHGRYRKFLLSNLFWFLMAVLTAGIGLVFVTPIVKTKKALFYENLKTEF